MRVCLMVEGQEGVTWEQWKALASQCERGGFDALFRSDHYLSVMGDRERGSLDAWATLAGIAAITSRVRLGTLVSPATFRHPSVLAKMAVTVDHISDGRMELGLGAGWFDDEHRAYGFPFPETKQRLQMLEEQAEIVVRSWDEGAFDLSGEHYSIAGLDARPKPVQHRPNLIIGGSGGPRSVSVCARFATEYNALFMSPGECSALRKKLGQAFEASGRDPSEVTLSLMATCVVGSTEAELSRRAASVLSRTGRSGSSEEWLAEARKERFVGTTQEVIDRLGELAQSGVDRVMLQHLVHDDVDMVDLIAAEVIPAVA